MSIPVLVLDEKIITDTGEVIYRHRGLMQKIQAGKSLVGVKAVGHKDVDRLIQSGIKVESWLEGEPEGVSETAFKWNIPIEFQELDWMEYLNEKWEEFIPTIPIAKHAQYSERFENELLRIEEKQMGNFVRMMIYVLETLRENKIPVGVGRGSACASFVLFLMKAHRIDPVLYEIPMNEFFK